MNHGITTIASLADLDAFDTIIDVRSPAEFAEDRIPGAINCPVLDNEQRVQIGTLYKQVSPFEAKKLGAALVAENIARHLRGQFLDRPKSWRPLIYCWRGGQRSGAMTTVFRQIGWNAQQLEGGYKTYRGQVLRELETLPCRYTYRVICGSTGSGKSRILQQLGALDAQIVDLEALASHKGSVLGVLPEAPQPTQKMFESQLRLALLALDPAQPVYIEAESRKIGVLQVPEALLQAMRSSECLNVVAGTAARVEFLLRDYDYFLADPEGLNSRLAVLKNLQSRETIARWQAWARSGQWRELVGELLEQHYDPLYLRSQNRNYTGFGEPRSFPTDDLSPAGIERVARDILR